MDVYYNYNYNHDLSIIPELYESLFNSRGTKMNEIDKEINISYIDANCTIDLIKSNKASKIVASNFSNSNEIKEKIDDANNFDNNYEKNYDDNWIIVNKEPLNEINNCDNNSKTTVQKIEVKLKENEFKILENFF